MRKESVLKEVSAFGDTVKFSDLSDEGLHDYFKTFSDYRRVSPKHAELLGWSVVGDILGKGANLVGKAFGKDKTKVGEFLKKKGNQLEEFYVDS